MPRRHLFTSESVTEGHPDKLAGEICTETYVDIPAVVRRTITDIGYTDSRFGIDGDTCGVATSIQDQSPDIAVGVDHAEEERDEGSRDPLDRVGAGDQGMMFGYASRETEQLMPMPIAMAHALAKRLADVRKAGVIPYLRPDGKSQVTIEYEDGRPVQVDTVVISAQDATKVDRSAAYMARYAAKNVVAAGLAERLQLQVAYAIGKAHPVSFVVETFGTEEVDPARLGATLTEVFDFRPAAIIEALDLRRPIYGETACYGHFGRKGFPWEETDRAEDLRRALA